MDFEHFPDWNPFILSLKGNAETGANLITVIHPPGSRAMTFKPVVLKAEAGREFRWLGKLFLKGLFDGEHYFLIEPVNDKSTRFVHGEIFKGILVPLFNKIFIQTRSGFELMNEALKKRCETSGK